jgi:hypothetical protein
MKLYGFNNSAENAVKITVTMNGFDMTNPMVMSEQRTVIQNGASSVRNYYFLEYSYRNPMSVKVELPDGKVLLNSTPVQLNNYVNFKGSASDTRPPVLNKESLKKNIEEKLLQRNLRYLDSLVNDLYGYGLEYREVELSYAKGDEYTDLVQAFNEASSALLQLENDENAGFQALNHPIEIWEKTLAEYVPGVKKQRVDDDLAIALSFNLLEAYFLRREDAKMQDLIQKLNGMSLSSNRRKLKASYDMMLSDLKKRKAAQPAGGSQPK